MIVLVFHFFSIAVLRSFLRGDRAMTAQHFALVFYAQTSDANALYFSELI
jgi:hypothetical protein